MLHIGIVACSTEGAALCYRTISLEGAACDVWEHEPARRDHPLFECDNFISSPHVAGLSVEGQIDNRTKQAEEVVQKINRKEHAGEIEVLS